MEAWKVCLLGGARFQRGEKEVPLRSRKARAVLASLLLPARVSAPFAAPPAAVSRQVLTERFWGDKLDQQNPRVHLRQTLKLLRETFGDDSFLPDETFLRVAPGAFVTDIDRLRALYRNAQAAPPEERLHLLIEADGEIQGPFLEGCFKPGDEGDAWVSDCRDKIHPWLAEILRALSDAFEEAGNLNGAFAAAQRAVTFQPDSETARERFWQLGKQTGQETPAIRVRDTDTFEQAAEKAPDKEKAAQLTGPEIRLFQRLFDAKRETLSPPLRKALLALAVLPAPFSAAIAAEVSRVDARTLRLLTRKSLLQRKGEAFLIPEAIRLCAWRVVPTSVKQRLEAKLAALCDTWLVFVVRNPDEPPPAPFTTLDDACRSCLPCFAGTSNSPRPSIKSIMSGD